MQPVWQADDSDPSIALQLISQRARMLTRSSGAAIALAHKGSMICWASVGNAPTLGCRVDVISGFSAECVRTGKVLRCDNSESDSRVDAENCRRLNIHSILAAPIRLGGEVVGVLEVFSPLRCAFHDSDVAVVEHLAKTVLVLPPSKTTSGETGGLDRGMPRPIISKAPNLLLQREPGYRVFFGNLIDLLHPPQTAPLKLTSRPATFWPDVLVPSQLPWDRFGQSMLLHVIMVAVLVLVRFGLSQRPVLRQRQLTFNKSDVVYYLPSEYPRPGKREGQLSPAVKAQPPAILKPPLVSVRGDSERRTQGSVAPPKIPLKQDLRLLKIIAANPALPALPFSATTATLPDTPGANVAALAPPPDISAVSPAQHLTLQTPAVVEPAPSVPQPIRQSASISIGHMEVVRPAPEIPLGSLSVKAQITLDRTATSVVAPPPLVRSLGNPGQRMSSPPDASLDSHVRSLS